ncbi:MAG: signal peptidase I [Nodosilinea sp.]
MKATPRVWVGRRFNQSPWLAVNLSAVLPGLGQLYNGATAKGLTIAVAHLGLIGFIFWSIFAPQGNTLRGLLTLFPLLVLYLANLWDSHRHVRPGLTLEAVSPLRYRPADPWYPVLLSHVLPGLGQLFLQQALAGGLLLMLGIGTAYLANFHPLLLLIPPVIWAVGCGLAYAAAPASRRQWGMLAGLLIAIIIVRLMVGATPVLVRQGVEQCIVPSESMQPTLEVGDRTFVRRQPTYQPRSGEIVVFHNPERPPPAAGADSDTLIVKRVIALAGQRVEVRQGQVWLDGSALAEPCLTESPDYQWGPQTVPKNHLFVLGDNRNNSRDSHVWGFLSQVNMLGPAYKIYWPPHRIQPLS